MIIVASYGIKANLFIGWKLIRILCRLSQFFLQASIGRNAGGGKWGGGSSALRPGGGGGGGRGGKQIKANETGGGKRTGLAGQ
jgi:hypothetical protein